MAALFITGVLLFIIGSIWERHDKAEEERRIREREARRRALR